MTNMHRRCNDLVLKVLKHMDNTNIDGALNFIEEATNNLIAETSQEPPPMATRIAEGIADNYTQYFEGPTKDPNQCYFCKGTGEIHSPSGKPLACFECQSTGILHPEGF